MELILNSSNSVNLPDLPESELEDTFILSGDDLSLRVFLEKGA